MGEEVWYGKNRKLELLTREALEDTKHLLL
jgi:hypothetical protein